MSEFIQFRHISNGVVKSYPAHYADHPVFGYDLEIFDPTEFEVDKVDLEDHTIPVDQRGQFVATPLDELLKDELVDLADRSGLDSSGTKAELISRIADNAKEIS